MTPHLNRLDETVQMCGHNICFNAELKKLSLIITKYCLLSRALSGDVVSSADVNFTVILLVQLCFVTN